MRFRAYLLLWLVLWLAILAPVVLARDYYVAPTGSDDFDQFHVRVDHRFSDRDLVFGRISRGRNDHHLNITPMLP